MTTEQIRNRTKTVTRRLGWKNVQPGQLLQAVVKGQGLKKGEHPEKLCVIRVRGINREPVERIKYYPEGGSTDECALEGFPDLTPEEFVEMFCEHNNCQPGTLITRIYFSYE